MRTPRSLVSILGCTLLAAACSSPPATPDVTPAADASVDAPARDAFDDHAAPPIDAPAGDDVAPADDAPSTSDAPVPSDTPTPPDAPASTLDYNAAGPLATRTLARVEHTLPTSTGCAGNQCRVAIDVTLPMAPGAGREAPYPLFVFSNGFQLTDDQYASYAERMASWGYAAVRWNTSGESFTSTIAHDVLGRMLVGLTDWAAAENARSGSALAGLVSTERVVLAGHSRGGKVSTYAAVADPRVVALVLVDPVNAAPPFGAAPPSAVEQLRMASRPIPVAAVGASDGGSGFMACAPAAENYARFYDAATGSAFEAVVARTGHMDFIDNRASCGVACFACADGAAVDAEARAFAQTIMVAWSERFVRGAATTRYTEGDWIAGEVSRMFAASTRHR